MGANVLPESLAAILSNYRVVVFAGAFGSGKTEVALNYALLAHGLGRAVVLVDLDVVNPYFRSQDHRARLAALGVGVAAQEPGAAGSEVPALSREIGRALRDPSVHAVVDLGGDPEGAAALGSLSGHVGDEPLGRAGAPAPWAQGPDMWMVMNASRPATATAQKMVEMARRIEDMARLRATGVVSNTHLGPDTRPQVIAAGHQVVAAAARILEVPVRFAAALEGLVGEPERLARRQCGGLGVPILPIRRMVRPPWEVGDGEG